MDLAETRTQHPNLIRSAGPHDCKIGGQTHEKSVIIPFDRPVESIDIVQVEDISIELIEKLCAMKPEIIIIATGQNIQFPDTDLLKPLIDQQVGLEVLNNQAAARTFNVLLAEDRKVVCLMLLNP